MTLAHPRRSNRRLGAGLGASSCFVLDRGGRRRRLRRLEQGRDVRPPAGRSVQVLATVRRGNLVDSVAGRLKLTSSASKVNVTAVVQVSGQNASQVAAGQPVTLTSSGAGLPQPALSGMPAPAAVARAAPAQRRPSGCPERRRPAVARVSSAGRRAARAAFARQDGQGTVTSVSADSNGSARRRSPSPSCPRGVTAKYIGIAQIQVKSLASNVLIIPTAAIKGSGSNATVQLLAERQDRDSERQVGQQTGPNPRSPLG